jgi:signal recognition particle subunit SRP54
MFDNLSERLASIVHNLSGRGRITAENIQESLRDIRIALLEADVALPVVNKFIEDVQAKAIGQEVIQSLRPGEVLVKIVFDELVLLMGDVCKTLNLHTEPPAVILMVGLQGCGKTTTVAKLARWLKENQHKKVLVVSTDIYRPAAMEQLQILAAQINVAYYATTDATELQDPVALAKAAMQSARKLVCDAVIIDTAGRLHIDEVMMREIKNIYSATNPIETLLVVDSMMGQDAVNTARAFADALPLTGIILTKTDGDARGGAALSMRVVTGKPIKFLGSGEKIHALEPFYPDRLASRILGMGDILTLVEEAQQKVDQQKAQKLARKFQKGKAFDFEDFKEQLIQMRNMGGIGTLLSKLPMLGNKLNAVKNMVNDAMFVQMEAIINSMTIRERRFPDLIKGSRKLRIANGSGTEVQDVNRLLKQFLQMQKMMKKLSGGKLMQMMQNFK